MTTATSASTSARVPSAFASQIRPGAERALGYAEGLVKDISPETFSRMPQPNINSPAFNLGHLSIYPDLRLLSLMGREDLVRPLPFPMELFKAGSPCVDEPGRYPPKDAIVETFRGRYRVALDALADLSDELLARPNPMEGRFRELFPTVGSAIAFLLVGHTQSHLGQISVWRRIMGLGSVY